MLYMGNHEWWHARFKNRTLNLMTHEQRLEKDLLYFPSKGKILDLACGDGRNTIYLARLGYEVIAVDFCEEALYRLNLFIKDEPLQIQTLLLDLSQAASLTHLDKVDGIIINHYRLNPSLYPHLIKLIKPKGILWVNGFYEVPKDNPNIHISDLLTDDDFTQLPPHALKDKLNYAINDRKFIRYIWQMP